MVVLKIKKIHPDAIIPKYAHFGDAGMDVFSIQEVILKPKERCKIRTGLKVEVPFGYELQARPKSGLAINNGITCLNSPGTIDAGYRGEICIILINHSSKSYKIEKGSKIAQLVLNKIEFAEIEEVDDLSETSRGEGGFGSTGIKYQKNY